MRKRFARVLLPVLCLVAAVCHADPGPETDLRRFFSDSDLTFVDSYRALAHRLDAPTGPPITAADVAAVFGEAMTLDPLLLGDKQSDDTIWPELDSFLNSDLGLPGLSEGCDAECTVPALVLDTATFARWAKASAEPEDDDFFALLGAAYGPDITITEGRPASTPTWFEQTWDYGGHSLLGTGVHLRLMRTLDAQRGTKLLADWRAAIRAALYYDLLSSSCLGLPAQQARAEVVEILTRVQLSPEEREALERRRDALGATEHKGLEDDCLQRNCNCDSG